MRPVQRDYPRRVGSTPPWGFLGSVGAEGASFGNFAAERGLTGTIKSIEGGILTVNTPEGTLQAVIAVDTTVRMFTQVDPGTLEPSLG